MSRNGRAATRGDGEVIELECGITVYPARSEGSRWRAVRYEDGLRGVAHRRRGTSQDAQAAPRPGARPADGRNRARRAEAGTRQERPYLPRPVPAARADLEDMRQRFRLAH